MYCDEIDSDVCVCVCVCVSAAVTWADDRRLHFPGRARKSSDAPVSLITKSPVMILIVARCSFFGGSDEASGLFAQQGFSKRINAF